VAAAYFSLTLSRQASAPSVPVPQIVTSEYAGTVTWLGNKWQQTDKIVLSPRVLAQMEKAVYQEAERYLVALELRDLLRRSQWSIQRKGSGLLLTPRGKRYTPKYLQGVAKTLNKHLLNNGWSVTRTSDRLVASPKRRGARRDRIAAVTDEATRNLKNKGWKAEQVGNDLVFTRSQVTEDTTSRLPMKSTRTFEVVLPTLVFRSGQEVRLTPAGTSRLVLSAPDNFIVATSPAESRQAGVRKEIITFSLKPDPYHRTNIDVETLNPWFRSGVFKYLATFTFTGFVRWIAAILAVIFSEQIKSVLLVPIRSLKQKLHIPEDTPEEDGT
jgi:hypothetical protein